MQDKDCEDYLGELPSVDNGEYGDDLYQRPSVMSAMSQDISVAYFGLDWKHAHGTLGKSYYIWPICTLYYVTYL